MENHRAEALRADLNPLFKKQTEVWVSRIFGAATDAELLEYEIREEFTYGICDELAYCAVG